MMKANDLNRRAFLKGMGAVSVFPSIVPASALGRDGSVAPGDRIVMGAIGVGARGMGNLRSFLRYPEVQVVAVCDVDQVRRDEAKKTVDGQYGSRSCKTYADFRDLLRRRDLDAVMIAVPDHWHAIPAIAAAKAGLDIFGEKPLARSIREGRAICDAVRRYECVWQTGSWQRSKAEFRRASELVHAGRIGKVHTVEVGLPTGRPAGYIAPAPKPAGLDWEFWLGPAPWKPYQPFSDDPRRRGIHWHWRWILDYSGGQLTDWAGHHVDIAHWGLGLDYTGPVSIAGSGTYPEAGLYNTPTAYKFTCEYANGLRMVVGDDEQVTRGTRWYGERGWIHVNRGQGFSASSEDIANEVVGPDERCLYYSDDHYQNFLDCVRTRQLTIAPAEIAHRSISVGLLGEIAMLTGRKIKWDPECEKIIDDSGASALLGRAYREPWVM